MPDSPALASQLDPDVRAWLAIVLPEPVTSARALSGGYRNGNTLIRTEDGGQFVVRQYLQDDAARTCAVEAALLRRTAGTVPVAQFVAADATGAEAGQPVLLTSFVAGSLLHDELRRPAGEKEAAELGRSAGVALGQIGAVTFDRQGPFADSSLEPEAGRLPGSLPDFVDRCLAAGSAATVLSAAEIAGLRRLAETGQQFASLAPAACRLVHSDFNPKNLLVSPGPDGWTVTAVLDWEFAFSGSPLVDVGNMLRFASELPAGFTDAFVGGFAGAGGELPDNWQQISLAFDLYALADLLTRPVGHRYFSRAVTALRRRIAVDG
jgi:aminoglycoside phosphotransferase (APT) family kinase protein